MLSRKGYRKENEKCHLYMLNMVGYVSKFWKANVIQIQSRKIIHVCTVCPYFHSSAAGHVDCFIKFWLLKVMLLWIFRCTCLFILVCFFEHIYSVMELLNNTVVLFLVFWGISILPSTSATPIFRSDHSLWRFPVLYILVKTA